ncbi:NACHT domain-containing protein [Streptomyces sp. NBC_01314]|uniref:NACHT domain-containing protein n=1 Tax=Streptomyces sp. NBC_01314 TaxID=2903821 RepID=UPI00308D605F|nr:NACHT domain-containing protein [Streptomyces sp. NBC_01314]
MSGRRWWWTRFYAVAALLAVAAVLYAWGVDRVDDMGKVIGVVAALFGLPPLVVTAFRLQQGATGAGESLEVTADALAEAIRHQWEAEAEVWRLNYPYPLPVAWSAADPEVMVDWNVLCEAARHVAGGPSNGTDRWAAGPEGLSGSGNDIHEVFFHRVPTRRLVVLGEPGSGKTMLLVRLLLALLDPPHREPGGAVPVLFALASFDPQRQDLHTWMTSQLIQDYPALGALAPGAGIAPGRRDHTMARALVERRLVLPLFDGLDEVPDALRSHVLNSINEVFNAKAPLVLTSRSAEYRQALAPTGGAIIVRLDGAAGIRLHPVDAETAITYLRSDAGGQQTEGADRWARVADALHDPYSPVGQALSTPLGLFMARAIYNPRPGESTGEVAHPHDLLNAGIGSTRAAVERHLYRAFVPAAYRPHPSRSSRWTPQQAERYLIFLARHMQYSLGGTTHLAWWQLSASFPAYLLMIAFGMSSLLTGATTGLLAGLSLGRPMLGVGSGLATGALICIATVVGLFFTPVYEQTGPSSGIGWLPNPFVAIGAGAGSVAGIAVGLPFGLENGVTTAIGTGLVGGLAGGLSSHIPHAADPVSPVDLLALDRRVFLGLWLVFGLAAGFVIGFRTHPGLGALAGFAFGAFVATGGALWWRYTTARLLLAAQGRIPWRLMHFLADAHERRGILRRVGAVYQFRHLTLQEHLAHRDAYR